MRNDFGGVAYFDMKDTFKFKIGQAVYYRPYGMNCIVQRQLLITAVNGTYKMYDLAINGKENPTMVYEAQEEWIDPDHRID